MIPGAIECVIRTLRRHEVRALLSGGQACIFYGAAEFSKDIDFVVLADAENFQRLKVAARELKCEVIAVPPFEKEHLDAGLAVHLRCQSSLCQGLRLDLMSRLRGVDSFDRLWERRSTVEFDDFAVDLLGVRDLIASKKTQRAKDWPMIQRLVEVHCQERRKEPSEDDVDLWLRELRTTELLIETAGRFSEVAKSVSEDRPLIVFALQNDSDALRRALVEEMEAEKERDRIFWEPLKTRLTELRHERRDES